MTIADELVLLNSTKSAIATAIEDRGVSVGSIPFSEYPEKISSIDSPLPYERPVDWLTLPTLSPGDQKFVGLYAVFSNFGYCALSADGAYTVDWGDGTVENFATGVTATHNFDYSALTGTDSSRGYRQAVVTVTPQAGQNLTNLSLQKQYTGITVAYATAWLDISIQAVSLATLAIGGTVVNCSLLEQVDVLDSVVTNWASMFSGCVGLQNIVSLDTASGTDFSLMFQNCYKLEMVPLFNTGLGTSFSNMFNACSSLEVVPPFNTSLGTNFNGMFINCVRLKSLPLLDTSLGTTFSTMFSGCTVLEEVPSFDTGAGTSFANMFISCRALKTIPLLDTSLGTLFTGMFNGCSSLETIPALNTAAGTSFTSMFSSCASLQEIPALNLGGALSSANYAVMFNACPSLRRIQVVGVKFSITCGSSSLSAAALDEIYTNLATVSSGAITVTGNFGTSGDTPLIATAKGWTVTGS